MFSGAGRSLTLRRAQSHSTMSNVHNNQDLHSTRLPGSHLNWSRYSCYSQRMNVQRATLLATYILNSSFTLESVYEFRVTYIPALKLTLHPVWLIDFHCVKNLLCLRGYSQFYCTSIPGLWSIDWTDVYRWLVRAAEIFFVVWIWWNGIFANVVNDLSMNFGKGILIYYSIWSYITGY